MSEASNNDQIAFWNGETGDRWVTRQDALNNLLAPFSDVLLGAANLGPVGPLRILDVGCGSGQTSLQAAEIGHEVTGIDVSEPLLEFAKKRGAQFKNLMFVKADASKVFIDPPFDLILSRFGVMFFADPVAAFRNFIKLTAPGGRLVFVCWRSAAENEMATYPIQAVQDLLPSEAFAPTSGPGPFAFGDQHKLTKLLEDAGYKDITLTPFDAEMPHGGQGLDDAINLMCEVGTMARAISLLPLDKHAELKERLRSALEPKMRDGTLYLCGAIWLVEATA